MSDEPIASTESIMISNELTAFDPDATDKSVVEKKVDEKVEAEITDPPATDPEPEKVD